MVNVVINGKEVSVYEAEASLLIEKGLASWPVENTVEPSKNKMIVPDYQNKTRGRKKK